MDASTVIPPEIQLIDSIRSLGNDSEEEEDRAPIILLNKNSCLSPELPPIYFSILWKEISDLNTRAVKISPLNMLLFYDLNNIPQNGLDGRGFLLAAKESGLSFLNHTPERLYKCPDTGKDVARVNTIYAIHTLVNETPIFLNKLTFLPQTQKLISLEKRIATADVIHEDKVQQYINELKMILLLYGENDLKQRVGEERVFFIEQLISIFEQNNARLDELIADAARLNLLNSVTEDAYGPSPVDVLMRVRGYTFLLLLLFNNSFAEQPLTFFSERKEVPLKLDYTVLYPNQLGNMFTKDEIIDIIHTGKSGFVNIYRADVLQDL